VAVIRCLIPTRGERVIGIITCINSIDREGVNTKILKNTTGWLPAVNAALKDIDGYFLMGADDMLFKGGAIQKALDVMEREYPDRDGVVGFNQVTLEKFCEAAFVLMGDKFMDRFPDRQVYCPDYRHYYADTEFMKYAKSVNKFTYCKEAEVEHYHPVYTGKQDETNKVSRLSYKQDRQTASERSEKGFLWGRDFGLINGV